MTLEDREGPRRNARPFNVIDFNLAKAGLAVVKKKPKTRNIGPIWTVQPDWKGETVFIVAGGTSVKGLDLSKLRGRRVIAVNSSYEAVPFADILFFADVRWYKHHTTLPAFNNFPGKRITVARTIQGDNFLRMKRAPQPGLAESPDSAVAHRTSLQGAINVAKHKGVSRIVLLGADMRRADDGTSHHHTPHKWRNQAGNKTWDVQMTQLVSIVEPLKQAGIEVINCSPITRLPWWPKMTLDEALALPDRTHKAPMASIKPTAYSVENMRTSPKWSRAWAKGCGGNFVTTTILEPGPVAVFGRPYLVLDRAWRDNRDWYYGDHAYFRRWKFFRVTRNAYQIDGTGKPDFDRWKALGIPIQPWRKDGRHIIVCPPDHLICERRKIDGDKWRADVRASLATNTDRPVIWRDNPRFQKDNPPPPLEKVLEGAWALVTHNSNAAVEALVAGVPVFLTGESAATAMAEIDLAKIEKPLRPDNREAWAAVLAANQWTLKEMEDGLCWRAIGVER